MPSRASAKRTLLAAVGFIAAGLIMMASPWYLGVNAVSKTTVAFGLLVLFVGGSCLLHGTWDFFIRWGSKKH